MPKILIAIMAALFSAYVCAAQTLNVSFLAGSGKHRDGFRQLVKGFEAENPDIKIKLAERANDQYHKWMETMETSDADVVWWFGGYQLGQYAARGSIEPITDVWNSQKLDAGFSAVKSSVSFNGEVYGLPFSYYQWGFYYKKSVFARLNLQEPRTWEEFLAVCDKLKAAKLTPLGIGTKEAWTAGTWFSYLNLRLNGLDFHKQLLGGTQSFKDPRVRQVFTEWKKLMDKGYFLKGHEDHDWKAVLPFLYRDLAGMYLIGNFAVADISVPLSEFGFFRFPVIKKDLPIYEEAPTDVLFINKTSTHKAAAKNFLAFMARPENQLAYNEAIGFIAPNRNARQSQNDFVRKGFEVLSSAKGVSQYFDRDTSKSMANDGFEALGEFARLGDIDKAVDKLESARLKHFKQ